MGATTLRNTHRLRPGVVAERALIEEWHRTRWVWNRAVEHLNTTGEWVTDRHLTSWRAEHKWLAAGSVVAQQQELRNFRTKRAFGSGRRKFRSARRARPSLNYTLRGFSLRDGRLCLPRRVSIPVVWSRPLPSAPTSVRVYRDSVGHWYASFVVTIHEEPLPLSRAGIGVDWGVSAVATTTDPAYDLPHPGYGKKAAARLAAAQRVQARRRPKPGQKASRGYRKASRSVARIYQKIARQRQDTARKWARSVVQGHGLIAVEDFRPGFLAKSTMARKAADAAVGTTKAILVEYAQRAGRKVVLVPPAYTTMTCSTCGTRAKARLLLSERTFLCAQCGHTQDRDCNAARVILATAGFNRAGADAVRHPDLPLEETRMQAEPGIPRP